MDGVPAAALRDPSSVDEEGAPRPKGPVRQLIARHPQVADTVLALAIGVLALPEWARGGEPLRTTVHVLLIAPLAVRRRWPVAVFAVLMSATFVQITYDVPIDAANLALLVALYTVATLSSRGDALRAAGVLELAVILAVARWGNGGNGAAPAAFVSLTGTVTAALVLGLYVRGRRAQLAYLEGRAARAERDRDQQARLAAAAERTRIARELHDVVAHNLAVMIALADGAAFTADRSPAQAADAMRSVSDTGRQALGEMRRLLGVLRDERDARGALDGPERRDGGAERSPQPGLHDLDRLVEQVRSAGLPVTFEVAGRPPALSSGAELTVYRIVQEALTNTLKHAGSDTSVALRLRYVPTGVAVDVEDDGEAAGPPAPDGHGLIGMRERTAAYGGTVDAGPSPVGGWHVRAWVPLDQQPVAP